MATRKRRPVATRHGATQPETTRRRTQALLRLDARAEADLAALSADLDRPRSYVVAAALHVLRQALARGEEGSLEGYEDRLTDGYEAAGE